MAGENQMSMTVHPDSQGVDAYSPQAILKQIALIQNVMSSAMKKGSHYGVVPGCGDKPTLLKPGAEKLLFLFRFGTRVQETVVDLPNAHREYRVTVTLFRHSDGREVGCGVGSCSTMEGKYRFRTEKTGKPVPKEYWDNKSPDVLGGPQFEARKNDGQWTIVRVFEHNNPADYYNTCLKMAKKRAQVDATLTATAASDIFTQDVEDIQANLEAYGEDVEVETVPDPPKAPINVGKPKPAPAPVPSTAPSDGSWQSVVIHFGKNKGVTLGTLQDQSLLWYIENWEPKAWPEGSNKFKQADLDLRMALNRAEADLKLGVNGSKDDEVPMEFQETVP